MRTGTRRKRQESLATPRSPETHYSEYEEALHGEHPLGSTSGSMPSSHWTSESSRLPQRQLTTPKKIAQGLGWFSIGLGMAEILAPRKLAKMVGVKRANPSLIRALGFREVASGISIFAQRKRPASAVWSRVAGDAVDLATLGAAFASPKSNKGKLAFATANVVAVSALDVICARQLSSTTNGHARGTNLALKSLIINRSPEDLYQAWRNFENLPRFLNNLESVQTIDPSHSHWVARAPAGANVEWDAEITLDQPNERIEWCSLAGSEVEHYGSIRFERATGDRGTIVHIELHYKLPGGKFGAALAKLFGHDPAQRAMEALRRFNQVMETGEVAVSEGTLYDNGMLTQRAAQPVDGRQPEWARSAKPARRTSPRQSTTKLEEGHAR